ncbi:pre-mRNA 3'-end-processing factor FIP1-like [Pollicipes pollicipes]|uniref:pre-mRNA 3'-end-processing factor FIP1-like n=1 Tax=Pollicipes pollicipes TaxID=41117 RepID=UPI0018852834|nr:pre-mRNA 3'-end-processing factor FIP1-like [Pollicipes pollicipes]
MSDENEDQWLYGSNPPPPEDVAMTDQPAEVATDTDAKPSDPENAPETKGTDGVKEDSVNPDEANLDITEDGDKTDDKKDPGSTDPMLEDIDDDSDDDVNVVIRDIPAPSAYSGFKIGKGSAQFSTPASTDKTKGQGNFAVNEFDGVGTINGVPAHEFNLDSLEDKPWRKPGADITDYFNYGFNEDTWRAYCERQKRMRLNESGAGIANLPVKPFQAGTSEKYASKVAQPPVRRYQGTIDVIGATAPSRRYEGDGPPVANFSLPPPMAPVPSYSAPPPGFGFPPAAPPPFYEPAYVPGQAWNNPPPPQQQELSLT